MYQKKKKNCLNEKKVKQIVTFYKFLCVKNLSHIVRARVKLLMRIFIEARTSVKVLKNGLKKSSSSLTFFSSFRHLRH